MAAAAKVLDEHKEEVNRLNVFPVPDGDTGTNMSLTIQSVVSNVANLPIGASGADIRKAVTTGALMGARGNSGVITSQILRGLCEGSQGFDEFDVESIAGAFDRAREVAFQAVRKPVEGTILTVLRDSAAAAKNAAEQELPLPDALDAIVAEAYASVQRTPDLLPVLKEHGVVDAGGFGLAIIFDAFTAALLGRSGTMVDEMSFARGAHPTGRAPSTATATSSSWIPTPWTRTPPWSSSLPWATASCAWARCRSSRCTCTPITPIRC